MKYAGPSRYFSSQPPERACLKRAVQPDPVECALTPPSHPFLRLRQKIDGFIPAIFIYLGFSSAHLLCDASTGVAGVASRPLETRLLKHYAHNQPCALLRGIELERRVMRFRDALDDR